RTLCTLNALLSTDLVAAPDVYATPNLSLEDAPTMAETFQLVRRRGAAPYGVVPPDPRRTIRAFTRRSRSTTPTTRSWTARCCRTAEWLRGRSSMRRASTTRCGSTGNFVRTNGT